jgi:hypothetical protein
VIAPAAVPELQKLLTFQHCNEGVGVKLALNDLGRDQPLTFANDKVEASASKPGRYIEPVSAPDVRDDSKAS